MKKNIVLLIALSSLLFSACSGQKYKVKKEVSQDEVELLHEALDNTEINIERLDKVTPLTIADDDPTTDLTKSIYDFGDLDSNLFFSIVDKDDHPAIPYTSTSTVEVTADDVDLYDNCGRHYPLASFTGGTGRGSLVVPTSTFDVKRVYYLELKDSHLCFEGKDPDIRRLTFYTFNRGLAEGSDVDYKDDIVNLDSTKVYYYDEDGYSPFFVYEDELALEKDTSFRVRHPSLDRDDSNTLYGKIVSINKNPNGAGYMVRYDPAKANDIFDKLTINESKVLDDTDIISIYANDEEAGAKLAQAIIHNPSMATTVYGLFNAFDVEPEEFGRSVIDWGSRIDIKFATSYDPNTATMTFSASASYTFYPLENLAITLMLEYKQTWRYDVTASVSIETEFIFPVGIDYTLQVVEDTQKEASFGVYIHYDHSGEYNEEEVKKNVQKGILEAFQSDVQKKSVFKGDGPTSTPGGETYPIFKIECTYFFPIDIYIGLDFYWELVPSIEVVIKYTSHTQRVDLCVSNSGGADPSSQSSTSCNQSLSFTISGKVHFEAGFKVSFGVSLVGFYKFFHAEVYLKAYGAIDFEGYLTTDISWNDGHQVTSNVEIGAKFEISVGLKVGIDLYLLFGGYNHEWPVVAVPLFGVDCGTPIQEFVNPSEETYISNTDYDSGNKQFNRTIGERHLLTVRYLNTKSFNVETIDMNYNDTYKEVYGAFVDDLDTPIFELKEVKTVEGTPLSPVSLSSDGHITIDSISGQEDFVVDVIVKVNDQVTNKDDLTKTIRVKFTNNDRQTIDIFDIDGVPHMFGSFVNGAHVVLPVPDPIPYKKFTGYKYDDFLGHQVVLTYDGTPESITYTVDTLSGVLIEQIIYETWIDYYHWEVLFMDGLNNLIQKQLVLNGEDAVEPDAEIRDRYMEGPDDNHVYQFVGWDVEFTNITAPTVVRAIYRIVAKP